jgi:sterol desaturase/sphingolipid hydroxylase (fatty acid hydroxylase superfamily)
MQGAMDDLIAQILGIKIALLAGWFVLLFALERLAPAAHLPDDAAGKAGWRRWGRNLSLFGLNSVLSPLFVLPVTVLAAASAPAWRPDWWGGAGGLIVDVLILDAFLYAWHRANHTIPLLWRFHQVHHADRFLDTTSAVRFHAGEVALSALARGAVVLALDIPLASVLVFEIVVLVCSLFHHSNAKLPAGLEQALSVLIVTPGWHWMHHHAVRRDTDSNYATLLPLWDRLFGSANARARDPDMPIGLEGEVVDPPLARLLLLPFRTDGRG